MNRIYKVIWNNDTAEWVAASELAHAKGKSKSASRTRLAALGLSALLAGTASAAIPEGTTAGPTDVAAGTGSEAKGSNSAAYGANAAANQVSATALGAAAAAGESATAVGASSKAAGTRSVAVGSGADAQAGDTVAVGGKAQASAQNAIAIGKEASVRAATAADLPSGITAAQTGQTTGMGSVAVGANAKAYGTNSTAFGQASNALGQNSFAGGQAAKAYGKSSVALGDGARADNDAAAAVGTSSRAANGGASAFGYAAHAAGFGASAFGRQAQALGNADISIGDNAGKNRKDFGTNNGGAGVYFSDGKLSSPAAAIATHTNIAIGKEAAANSGGIRNIAVGSGAGISHFGEDSVDIGTNANNFKANGAADGTKTDTPTRARYTVAVGSNAMTYGDNAVALGSGAKAKHSDALALGSASETEDAVATTSATVGGISYGGFAGSSPAANASIGSNTVKRTLTNVAAGRISATSTDAVNGSQLYAVADTLSGRLTRYYSVKSSATGAGSNYDNDGATGNNALAAGVKASASALNTVAVGYNAQAGRDGAVSVGADTKATSASTALGNGANAAGENSTALGWGAYAAGRADVFVGKKAGEGTEDSNNFSNIGIGEGAVKDAGKTTAVTNIIGIGTGAAVGLESSHNIALGAYSNNKLVTGTAVTGSDNIAVGQRTIATGGGSIAVGTKAQASDLSAVAVGLNAVAQGQQAVALGRNTKAAGAGSVAVGGSANDGKGAAANGSQSVAIGQLSNAATTGASALGVNAQAAHQKGVALGYESATEANVTTTAATINGISYSGFAGAANANVSIGKSGFTRTLTNVAAGRISATSTDAVNGSQLYAVAGTLSDRLTRYYSVKSSATGAGSNYNNDGATGADALAAGVGASAQQTSSVAIGKNAVAEGNAAVSDSIAVGTGAKASGNASLAIGPGASTSGSDSLGGIAIGAAATSKNGGLSLGSGADSGNGTALIPGMPVRLNNNVALGDSATVKDNTNFRVALGSMSIAGVSDLDAAPYKPSANAQVKGIAASGVTLGEVSVGGDNRAGLGQILYRRITNLAAGSEDTDAVNVSQLKALAAAGTKVVGAGLAGVSSDTDKAGATTYTVNVAQAATPNVTRGNVTVAAGDAGKVMTAGDVAAAINKSEKTSSVTAGSAAVSVKAGKEDAAGNTQYTVDLGTAAKASLAKADSAVQNIVSSSPNLSANKSGDTVTIGMSENPVFTSVRTGDTLLNGSGLTIAPAGKNPVVLNSDGLNNGGNRITNVGKGTVSDTSTEAVNGSQLYALAEKPLTFTGDSGSVNRKLGETLGIKGDGTYVSTKAQNGSVNITVSENAVRDAARKAVEVKGEGVITVTPAQDNAAHKTTYTVRYDGGKAAAATDISYTANGGAVRKTSLAKGFNFSDGANTTAAVDANGVVKFNAVTGGIAVTNGKAAVAAGDAGKLATAGDVADAINKSEKTSSVTAGSAAVSVKAGKEDAAGNTQYTVDLGNAAKASLAKADSAVQNIVSSSPNLSANKSGDTVTIGMSENPVFTSVRTGDTLLNGSGLTIAPAGKNPVVLNSDGLNNGGNKITNVGKGTVSDTSTEAVNGSQLYALAEKPLTFTGDSGSVNRKLGETLGIKGDGTYVSTKAQNGSVNITVSENAVRDAARKAVEVKGEGVITVTPAQDNVAHKTTYTVRYDGGKAAAATDISYTANGGVVRKTSLAKGFNFSDGANTTAAVDANGVVKFNAVTGGIAVTNGKATVAAGDAGKLATAGDVAAAVNNAAWKVTAKADGGILENTAAVSAVKADDQVGLQVGKNLKLKQNGRNFTYSLNDTLTGLNSASFGGGTGSPATVINGTGVSITPAGGGRAVSLTGNGLDNGGNKITNVASGGNTDSNAANIGDVKKAAAAARNTVSAGDANVTVSPNVLPDGHTDYAVKLADNVSLGAGKVSLDGTSGNISAADSVKAGNTVVAGQGVNAVTLDGTKAQVKAGSVLVDGKAGNITGLSNTAWVSGQTAPVSGRAATEDQLKAVDNQVAQNKTDIANLNGSIGRGLNFAGNTGSANKQLGQTMNIVGEGTKADSRYSGENVKTAVDANGNLVVKTDKDLKAESLTLAKDGNTGLVLGTENGAGKIALNGTNGAKADIGAAKGAAVLGGTAQTDRIRYNGSDGTPREAATMDDGMSYGGDNLAADGTIAKKLNQRLDIIGGADKSKLSDNNIGVNKDSQGRLKVQLSKELNGMGSASFADGSGSTTVVNAEGSTVRDSAGNQTAVQAGGVSITASGKNPVVLNSDGLNNGGNKITNVAAGERPTDAVNLGQLNARLGALTDAANLNFNALEHKIDNIGETANAGVAGAIAQGTIPQVTRPGASGLGVGSGYYGGQSALAVGMSSMSDGGNWIVKGNVSVNTKGRVGAGAGALYQW